jgi:large subunit ribosomal protein L3
MEVYGMRLYSKDTNTHYKVSTLEVINSNSAKKLHMKVVKNDESKLGQTKAKISEFTDVVALVAAFPKGLGAEQHHPSRFEAHVGGKTMEEKFDFVAGMLGKELKAADVFKSGEFVDVTSISKGKGWQGPVKRFGIAVQYHKATGKTRHVGSLGPFGVPKVLYGRLPELRKSKERLPDAQRLCAGSGEEAGAHTKIDNKPERQGHKGGEGKLHSKVNR